VKGLRALCLALALLGRSAVASPEVGSIRVSVVDSSGLPIPGARLQLFTGPKAVAEIKTDIEGHAAFSALPSGHYDVVASFGGFEESRKRDVVVYGNASLTLEFKLSPMVRPDSIEVTGTTSPVEQSSAAPATVTAVDARQMPSRPATVADALPMIPGVVRTPGGGLNVSGSPEHRSAMVVNSADVTDPATGQFGLTVPIDSVETVNVYQTPFLAEYGRFTAGMISVETRRGGEKWKWELNDPLPEFFVHSYRLRGLRDATPRINFEGPLVAGKLYFSEGVDFEVRKTPVYTLPFPFNLTKQEGVNSFAQLDWIMSDRNLVTGTVHVAPQRLSYVNLDYFNPEPTSPDASTHNYTGTLADRLTIFGGLLETVFSTTRFDASVWGQGPAALTLTPTGNTGNYFSQQHREASRYTGGSTFSPKPIHHLGTHNLKFGGDFSGSNEDASVSKHPINILDNAGRLIENIAFTPGLPFEISDVGYAFFVHDHWVVTSRLALDMGMRAESQEVTESFRLAPRVGLSWSPIPGASTVVRAGFGWFYDRVPLDIYGFASYPREIQTFYGPDGDVTAGPFLFKNTLGEVFRHHKLIFQGPSPGNFSPQSNIWSFQVEQPVARDLRLRVGYTQNDSDGLVTVNSEGPDLTTATGGYLLSGTGNARYRQIEATARYRVKGDSSLLNLSYVYSRARGDLNDFNNYLSSFPAPIIRSNQVADLPASLPHRFLAWGVFKLPAAMRIAPLVEYRSGFPFSTITAQQDYAGVANSNRYPHFFSLDSRVSKDIALNPKYSVRLSLSSFNLTNHFNPEAVHANIADPAFDYFFGHRGRRFTVDFDFLF
jgi:Carboxypeptidase regulatory-like domain/TonB-dependent Receptor Plug Domain